MGKKGSAKKKAKRDGWTDEFDVAAEESSGAESDNSIGKTSTTASIAGKRKSLGVSW